jgi:pyruvate/2-oxoglutarate dehydrogenase complex dihydrolipoamide dehydrogenase (E3) component
MQAYDAIIIGAGQAGPSLAKRLAGASQRVAIIERQSFGGTCINTGCTPTKTLVASAYAAHMARRAAEFGVVLGDVSVDMRRVKQRKDDIVASWSAATEKSLRATENCTVYRGHARFVGPHELAMGEERLGAERVFITSAAGRRCRRSPASIRCHISPTPLCSGWMPFRSTSSSLAAAMSGWSSRRSSVASAPR